MVLLGLRKKVLQLNLTSASPFRSSSSELLAKMERMVVKVL